MPSSQTELLEDALNGLTLEQMLFVLPGMGIEVQFTRFRVRDATEVVLSKGEYRVARAFTQEQLTMALHRDLKSMIEDLYTKLVYGLRD